MNSAKFLLSITAIIVALAFLYGCGKHHLVNDLISMSRAYLGSTAGKTVSSVTWDEFDPICDDTQFFFENTQTSLVFKDGIPEIAYSRLRTVPTQEQEEVVYLASWSASARRWIETSPGVNYYGDQGLSAVGVSLALVSSGEEYEEVLLHDDSAYTGLLALNRRYANGEWHPLIQDPEQYIYGAQHFWNYTARPSISVDESDNVLAVYSRSVSPGYAIYVSRGVPDSGGESYEWTHEQITSSYPLAFESSSCYYAGYLWIAYELMGDLYLCRGHWEDDEWNWDPSPWTIVAPTGSEKVNGKISIACGSKINSESESEHHVFVGYRLHNGTSSSMNVIDCLLNSSFLLDVVKVNTLVDSSVIPSGNQEDGLSVSVFGDGTSNLAFGVAYTVYLGAILPPELRFYGPTAGNTVEVSHVAQGEIRGASLKYYEDEAYISYYNNSIDINEHGVRLVTSGDAPTGGWQNSFVLNEQYDVHSPLYDPINLNGNYKCYPSMYPSLAWAPGALKDFPCIWYQGKTDQSVLRNHTVSIYSGAYVEAEFPVNSLGSWRWPNSLSSQEARLHQRVEFEFVDMAHQARDHGFHISFRIPPNQFQNDYYSGVAWISPHFGAESFSTRPLCIYNPLLGWNASGEFYKEHVFGINGVDDLSPAKPGDSGYTAWVCLDDYLGISDYDPSLVYFFDPEPSDNVEWSSALCFRNWKYPDRASFMDSIIDCTHKPASGTEYNYGCAEISEGQPIAAYISLASTSSPSGIYIKQLKANAHNYEKDERWESLLNACPILDTSSTYGLSSAIFKGSTDSAAFVWVKGIPDDEYSEQRLEYSEYEFETSLDTWENVTPPSYINVIPPGYHLYLITDTESEAGFCRVAPGYDKDGRLAVAFPYFKDIPELPGKYVNGVAVLWRGVDGQWVHGQQPSISPNLEIVYEEPLTQAHSERIRMRIDVSLAINRNDICGVAYTVYPGIQNANDHELWFADRSWPPDA